MASPNILLVVLDSVRARNSSLYGYENPTTPFLESFAESATVYTQARSPSIHTVSSHASIFTGYHVPEHRVTTHESALDPTSTIWHELSAEHGYETGLFSPNLILTVTSNLAEPFDVVDGPRRDDRDRLFETALSPTDIEGHQSRTTYLKRCVASGKPIRSALNGLFFLYGDRGTYDPADEGGHEYVDSFLKWSADQSEPWAACLNLMDAHYPYRPLSEFDHWGGDELQRIHDGISTPPSRELAVSGEWWKLRAIESLYDGCIRQADDAMEQLINGLRSRGDLDDTLVVITSDHGEGFGEPSLIDPDVRIADHSWGIDEVLTHIPLLVSRPTTAEQPDEPALASLTRFPTVVRTELDGTAGSFTVDDQAIAMTERLEDPELVLPKACPDRAKYGGPWLAVYQPDGERVIKYASHDTRTMAVRCETAARSYAEGESSTDVVERTIGALEDAHVNRSADADRTLDHDVERQLEELGYLR